MKNKKLPMVLNKKNAIDFANHIFRTTPKGISYLKLCEGYLADGSRDGKRPMHCAIGEAYVSFVNKDIKEVQSLDYDDYKPKYCKTMEEQTAVAIDTLVDIAKCDPKDRRKLAHAMEACVNSNDSAEADIKYNDDGEIIEPDDFFARAKSVAETWLNKVVPLLK